MNKSLLSLLAAICIGIAACKHEVSVMPQPTIDTPAIQSMQYIGHTDHVILSERDSIIGPQQYYHVSRKDTFSYADTLRLTHKVLLPHSIDTFFCKTSFLQDGLIKRDDTSYFKEFGFHSQCVLSFLQSQHRLNITYSSYGGSGGPGGNSSSNTYYFQAPL